MLSRCLSRHLGSPSPVCSISTSQKSELILSQCNNCSFPELGPNIATRYCSTKCKDDDHDNDIELAKCEARKKLFRAAYLFTKLFECLVKAMYRGQYGKIVEHEVTGVCEVFDCERREELKRAYTGAQYFFRKWPPPELASTSEEVQMALLYRWTCDQVWQTAPELLSICFCRKSNPICPRRRARQ